MMIPRSTTRTTAIITSLLLATAVFAEIDDPRGVQVKLREELGENASVLRYHALVIGINRYQHWQSLRRARPDAEELANLLEKRYQFASVTRLFDEQATKESITVTLRETLNLDENDALLIFYAGHGFFDEEMDEGYWVPYEARNSVQGHPATIDWLANSELLSYLGNTRARHVLVVSDSCFSGSLFRGEQMDFNDKANTWYRGAIMQPSRWGITSGDLEHVPDRSVFSRKFIEALQFPTQPLFAASEVAFWIKNEVAARTGTLVQYGHLQVDRGTQRGEFIFLDFGGESSEALKADVIAAEPAASFEAFKGERPRQNQKVLHATPSALAEPFAASDSMFKIGIHGGLSTGGDVEQDSGALGAQVTWNLNNVLSAEVSGTKITDHVDVTSLSVMHLAFTLRAEKSLGAIAGVYLGGGVSYNQFEIEIDLPEITVDVNDSVGTHACVGARTKLFKHFEIFGEYRMTWLDTAATIKGPSSSEVVEGSFDFGTMRIGLNFLL